MAEPFKRPGALGMYGIRGKLPGDSPLYDTPEIPSGEWIPCHSSNIRKFRYDLTLDAIDVEFLGGRVARYYDEPWSKYKAFVDAPSKGVFHAAHIKPSKNWSYV